MISFNRFPSSVNETAVRSILCDTNYQQVLDQLLIEFDIDILIQEVSHMHTFTYVNIYPLACVSYTLYMCL